MSTTSLKLSDDLKQLAHDAAERKGVSPHAFMVEAIRLAATAEKMRGEFVASAVAARSEAITSGKGISASDVHGYLRDRASGKRPAKPKPKSWRS
jgi:predicted transcriptional regulator